MDDRQIERYARHILLPAVGGIGQQRLLDARVGLDGDGGAAETAALYLCAGGVGSLRLTRRTAAAWGESLKALNPDCTVTRSGDVDLELTVDGDDRVRGAMAAQRTLVVLSGAADPDEFDAWTTDRGGFTWG